MYEEDKNDLGGFDDQDQVDSPLMHEIETADPFDCGADHNLYETQEHLDSAAVTSITDDAAALQFCETQASNESGISVICDVIIRLHRQRRSLHKAEKSLTLQMKAICRSLVFGDGKDGDQVKKESEILFNAMFGKGEHEFSTESLSLCSAFIQSRDLIKIKRSEIEKLMAKEAKKLPVYSWVEATRGFAAGSLAAIVGEAGNLSNYANPAKLWKRMGLAVINGERQRLIAGADAILQGYNPERRSVMWNIGQSVFKAQSAKINEETGEIIREAGEYRLLYDKRKEYESTKVEKYMHHRAIRYMEKRILLNLWKAWRTLEAPNGNS